MTSIWKHPSLRLLIALLVSGVLIMGGIVLFIGHAMDQQRADTDAVVRRELHSMALYEEARIGVLNETGAVAAFSATHDQSYRDLFGTSRSQVEQSLDSLDALTAPDEGAQSLDLAQLRATHRQFADIYAQILDALAANDLSLVGRLAATTSVTDTTTGFLGTLKDRADGAQAELLDAQTDEQGRSLAAERFSLAVVGLWIVVILFAATGVYRSVLRPIERMEVAARAIAGGDPTARAPPSRTARGLAPGRPHQQHGRSAAPPLRRDQGLPLEKPRGTHGRARTVECRARGERAAVPLPRAERKRSSNCFFGSRPKAAP